MATTFESSFQIAHLSQRAAGPLVLKLAHEKGRSDGLAQFLGRATREPVAVGISFEDENLASWSGTGQIRSSAIAGPAPGSSCPRVRVSLELDGDELEKVLPLIQLLEKAWRAELEVARVSFALAQEELPL